MKCAHQVAVDLRFGDVASGAHRLRGLNEIVILVNGQKDNPGTTSGASQLLRNEETVCIAQIDVQKDDVRVQFAAAATTDDPEDNAPTITNSGSRKSTRKFNISLLSSTHRSFFTSTRFPAVQMSLGTSA